MSPHLGRLCLSLVLATSALGSGVAHGATSCQLSGGPSSFQVLRIDLPAGSDYLGLGIGGRQATQVIHQDESAWHLSSGVIIINAQTAAIGAYWIHAVSAVGGGAPPRAVIEIDGQTVVDQRTPVSEGAFVGEKANVPPGLPPGTWYAVGFGIGGGQDALGRSEWRATVISDGISCEPLAVEGSVFDYNQTHFSGGTQVYASGVGMASDVKLRWSAERRVVAGLLAADVFPNFGGQADLSYSLPHGGGQVSNSITPLASTAGLHEFTANYQGTSPTILVAGVAFNV